MINSFTEYSKPAICKRFQIVLQRINYSNNSPSTTIDLPMKRHIIGIELDFDPYHRSQEDHSFL